MLMNYYRRLSGNGIQFDFMVHRSEKGDYDDEISRLGGVRYVMPPIRPGGYQAYFKALRTFFAEHPEYGIVHAHINENSAFVLRAAREAGVRHGIAHSHMSDLAWDYKLPFRLYARRVLKSLPSIQMACSARAGRWLYGGTKKNGGSERPATVLLPNAIDVSEYRFDPIAREEIRREWKAGAALVLGHVGRFCRQKNHAFLLRIFREIRKTRKDAMLVLAGDGPLRKNAERLAVRLGISAHVLFLGVRSDIGRLLQGMDVFLLPSRYEGLPLVLIEAQAAGLPCVVSDAVTRESDLSGNLRFVSLKASLADWSRCVLGTPSERSDTSGLIKDRGYDSAEQAEWLKTYYFGLSEIRETAGGQPVNDSRVAPAPEDGIAATQATSTRLTS